MFPHPVPSFLGYVEVPSSILEKNKHTKSVVFYMKLPVDRHLPPMGG